MKSLSEKDRLLRILKGQSADRPAVICPGGMMSAAVTGLVAADTTNHHWDAEAMARMAVRIHDTLGFENYGVPFCMTCEAEPFGALVSLGDSKCEPRIAKYNELPPDAIMAAYDVDPRKNGRMPEILRAIGMLRNDVVPVIGNITGPFSTATSIIDPLVLLRMLRREPEHALRFIEYINGFIIAYAEAMVEEGADAIAVSDPTATGEILGRESFEAFVLPMYIRLLERMKRTDTPVIIHICGNAGSILDSLSVLDVHALSFDSAVNMKFARKRVRNRLMGNVSTTLLKNGSPEKVIAITENAMRSGVDVVSPACGLDMATSALNLRVMTDYVKGIADGCHPLHQ